MGNPIKLKTKVEKIIEFGHDMYDVYLKPLEQKPRFKAGQFLHLALDKFDNEGGFWPESRVFSIASSPEDEKIRIIFSVKGSFTNRMSKELVVGREVWIKLPYGTFIIDDKSSIKNDIVLVAGGTGISPYLGWLSKMEQTQRKVVLHYGVRRNSYIIPMLNLASCIDVCFYIEDEDPMLSFMPGAKVMRGRLSIESIFRQPNDGLHSIYYLSGPPQMIKCFNNSLRECGVPVENIRIDDWE